MQTIANTPAAYSPPAHQRQVDEIQAAIRAELAAGAKPAEPGRLRPAPGRPAQSSDPLDRRISEELECIRAHLEQLGGFLAGNPSLVQRHATQLQSIDRVNQVLGHLSRVIASEDKPKAVEQVTLQELRARLTRKPLSSL
jgi:glutathione S-transferase